MHAVERYVKILEEGAAQDLFDPQAAQNNSNNTPAVAEVEGGAVTIQVPPNLSGEMVGDINFMRAAGTIIDDD